MINQYNMEVNYTTEYSNPHNNLIEEQVQLNNTLVVNGLFIGFATIHAVFKTWSYCLRNANKILTARTVWWFTIYSIETIGNYLLLVSCITCIYMFVVYKGQTVQHVSLPGKYIENLIKTSTIIAFGAKMLEMISLMRHHRNVNIFFIDWEQPRKLFNHDMNHESPHTSLKKSYMQKYPHGRKKSSQMTSEQSHNRKTNKTFSQHSRDNISTRRSIDNQESYLSPKEIFSTHVDISPRECDLATNRSVSTWRTCFVANQWLGIKTKRKTSVIFQIIATLFILEIGGLKYWSLAIPGWTLTFESDSQIQNNFIFAYAVATGTFIFVYSVQWLTYTLYETYVKNYLQEFVDLCSVTNISIFILSHNYLGYYIHGRSVHGFADKDLASLINDLENEENNQCAHRGLVPGTREQMFVVAVSKIFRSRYNAILVNADDKTMGKFSRQYLSSNKESWNERWRTRSKLHEFFCTHLDHCLKHVDYTVQERRFIEKLCDIELTNTSEKSIFYIDKNYSFDQTIFHGNEWALATSELVTFLFVMSLGGNWIICAGVTLFISKFIAYIAQIDQKKQLAAKTLIDKRFLV